MKKDKKTKTKKNGLGVHICFLIMFLSGWTFFASVILQVLFCEKNKAQNILTSKN